MKTWRIELQCIKALTNSHGPVQAQLDAVVAAAPPRDDDGVASTTLNFTVENARVLFLLLEAQLAEVDSRKARSQR